MSGGASLEKRASEKSAFSFRFQTDSLFAVTSVHSFFLHIDRFSPGIPLVGASSRQLFQFPGRFHRRNGTMWNVEHTILQCI